MSLISTKARYALHGLAYVASREGSDPTRFADILAYLRVYAPDLSLSSSYLAKVFQDISRAGLVEAVPGPRGGYRLSRPSDEIPLIDIIDAMDGPESGHCCLLSVGRCSQKHACQVGELTWEAERAFRSVFVRETLATLASKMSFPKLPRAADTGS